MLVLSRKQKQEIRIGEDIVVTILQVKGNSVRVGIEAPRSVHVVRGELDTEEASKITAASKTTSKSTSKSSGLSATSRSAALAEQSSGAQRAESGPQEILELKIHGGDSKAHSTNRLTQILAGRNGISQVPTSSK